jgi:hypothetical protein
MNSFFLAREDGIEASQSMLRIPLTALGNSRGAAQRLDDLALDVVIPAREKLVCEIFDGRGWMDPGFSALPDAESLFVRRPDIP